MDIFGGKQKEAEAKALAEQVLLLSRSTLTVRLRYLDRALSRLTPVCSEQVLFACDGRRLYYDPWYVLGVYKAEPAALTRNYLHSLLHCVFRHSFVGKDIDRARWDLAADVAVENAITELAVDAFTVRRCTAQKPLIDIWKAGLPLLTAEKLYRWLSDRDVPKEELQRLRETFAADEHGMWYDMRFDEHGHTQEIELVELWEEVGKRMEQELAMREEGNGALIQNLKSLRRAQRSYTDFLRRFGVQGEVVRVSDEEFDNIYYTYGMNLYGNMPLIEPLEYREQRLIREFVIAIDTSGSVRGDVVQSFVQHTHDILMRQENFFTKVNLHIIQCDDRIREDARITCREDFDRYMAGLTIQGLGETDFRPVFAHVDELIRQGELTDLRGLIYFTDGLGRFPAKKPDYDTAFIIHESDGREPDVPVWAMRMTLTEEDILDKRFSN